MSGPAPTATSVRVLEGNPSHRPLRAIPVAFGIPVKPSWLHGSAADIWRGLVPELQRTGVVGQIDSIGLANLCVTWASLIAVDRELADPARRDDARLARRSNQLRGLLLPQLVQFGMTPAARSRLTPPASPTDDTMGGLLR